MLRKKYRKWLGDNKYLVLIIFIAFVVRVWGINHGFPFLYHPDEPSVVNEALALPTHRLNPGHFDWPHLQIYLSAVVFFPFYVLQVLLGQNPSPLSGDLVPYYFLGRLLTAIMGTATVFIVWLIAKELVKKKEALLAAGIMALNVSHVAESHVATIDVPMTFWLTLSLYFAFRILKEGTRKYYILAGLFAGMAISTKYNAGLIVMSIIGAHLYRHLQLKKPERAKEVKKYIKSFETSLKEFRKLVIAGGATLIGFLMGTPFALLDYKTFLSTESPEGALWQFVHVGSGGLKVGILERYSGIYFSAIATALGLILALLALVGFLNVLRNRNSKELRFLLLPFVAVYFLYVGTFSYSPAHFFIPLYPYLSIIAVVGFSVFIGWLERFFDISVIKKTGLYGMLLFLVFLQPAFQIVKNDYVLTQTDTRTLAYEWVEENIPAGSGIVVGYDYEPLLDTKKYDLYDIHEFLLEDDLSGPIYPKFNDRGIRYGVLGGYDLEERLEKANWDKNDPRYPDYLLDEAGIVKRFDPINRPGPIVMIFEIDYKYEVLKEHKETDARK